MLRVFTHLANLVVYDLVGLSADSRLGGSLHFFVEDVTKIFVLVTVMIYLIGVIRAGLRIERVRDLLSGKNRVFGYAAASALGAVTPFCSCSSIPLFLGFTQAGIPLGITIAFLITSPIVNEVAVVLLGGILGVQFMVTYLAIGLAAGIIGGAFLDLIGAERYLTPLVARVAQPVASARAASVPAAATASPASDATRATSGSGDAGGSSGPSLAERHAFAVGELGQILGRIWKWILIGVGVGALFHGFVPESFVSEHLGDGRWWSVPGAVLLGIPLYSNAGGMIPVAESLLGKGLPVGTTMAFMMSTVAASFPEMMLLKQVMKPRLLLIFFTTLLVFFTLAGWILNATL